MALWVRHARLMLFLVGMFGWVDSTPLYGSVLQASAAAHRVSFGPLPLWFLIGDAVGLVASGYLLDRHVRAVAWAAATSAAACALLAGSLWVLPGPDWRFALGLMGLAAAPAMVSWGRWFATAVSVSELGRVFGWTAAAVVLVGKAFEVAVPAVGAGWGFALSLVPLAVAIRCGFGFQPPVRRAGGQWAPPPQGACWTPEAAGAVRFACFITLYSLVAGLSYRFFIAVPVTPYTNDTVRLLPYAGTVIAAGYLADRHRLMLPVTVGAGALAVAFLIGAWPAATAQYVGLGLNGAGLGLLESAPWLLLAANARPATAGRWFGWGLNLNVVPILLGGAIGALFHAMDPTKLGLLAAVFVLLAILSLYGVQDPLVPLRQAKVPPASPEESAMERFVRRFSGLLTGRELEIGCLALQGVASREISERLYISQNTVKTHLRNVYRKTGAANRAELLRHLVLPTPPDRRKPS